MNKFSGECVGGPWSKKLLVHWERTKKLYRQVILTASLDVDNQLVEAIEIGEYRLNNYNQWHWWETESGRAITVLCGRE